MSTLGTRRPPVARRWSRPLAALAVALVASSTAMVFAGPAAAAVAVPVSGVELTWKLSENAFSASPSLAEAKAAEAPATLDATDGWVFTGGTGTYDPYTGETHLSFAGALSVGNTSFGNFGERLEEPVDRRRRRRQRVAQRRRLDVGPGPGGFGASTRRRLATYDAPDDQVTVVDGNVSWTFTPFFNPLTPGGPRQFDDTFVSILPAAFQPSFRETAPNTQPLKAPSPVAVSFAFDAPTTSASQTTGLNPTGQAITVNGSGFRPDINLFVVNCDANFDAGARCDFGHFGQAHTDANGNFSIPLTVVASFGSAPNNTDCMTPPTACAIQTSWVENPRDRSQETTLPISFSTTPPPPPTTAPPALPSGGGATAAPVVSPATGTRLAFTGSSTVPFAVAGGALVVIGVLCVHAAASETR